MARVNRLALGLFPCALALAATALLGGCAAKSSEMAEDESQCKAVKPGTVTTVNHYCVVMPEDPVDPALVAEHKGQKVGFCCPGCTKKWAKMTDAEKDKAIAFAVAKGKP
ncbi:MAG: hypothetical protein JNK35_08650 [Phycisphaerae bacterium]|nr:hypothetical protein [Phycisphaerae bacterium]